MNRSLSHVSLLTGAMSPIFSGSDFKIMFVLMGTLKQWFSFIKNNPTSAQKLVSITLSADGQDGNRLKLENTAD